MRGTLILCLLLAGCAASPPQIVPIEKPVLVAGPTQYVAIPAGMFAGCTAPSVTVKTNGDLLQHDHDMTAYAACLLGELDAIHALK